MGAYTALSFIRELNLMPFAGSILDRHKDVFHRTRFHKPFKNFTILKLLKRGIKWTKGQQPTKVQCPITAQLLYKLHKYLRRETALHRHDKAMLWAAFTTAFFGLLRTAEFTAPRKFEPKLHLSGKMSE